jgi:hypothetical protein
VYWTGRRSIELSKTGYGVTGVDLSDLQLARAKLKAEKLGLKKVVSKYLLEHPWIPRLHLALESMLPHRHIIISFQHNAVFVEVMGKIDVPFVIERRLASKLRNN